MAKRYMVALVAVVAAGVLGARRGEADPPAGRYTITDSTVVDTETTLMWQRHVDSGVLTAAQAKTYCTGLVMGGHDDWRLPKRGELLTIVDIGVAQPSIDAKAFPNSPSTSYWTSSPVSGYPGGAWSVNFGYGSTLSTDVSDANRVRCVR